MFVVPICSFHEQFKYANVELSSGIASELILLFQVVDRKHTNLSKLKLTMLSFLVEAFYSLKVPFCLTWTVVWICVCCINWRASLLARSSNVQIRFLFQNLLHTLAIMVGQVYLCARRQSQSNWTSRWILLLFLCQLSQLQKIITTLIKTSQVCTVNGGCY